MSEESLLSWVKTLLYPTPYIVAAVCILPCNNYLPQLLKSHYVHMLFKRKEKISKSKENFQFSGVSSPWLPPFSTFIANLKSP